MCITTRKISISHGVVRYELRFGKVAFTATYRGELGRLAEETDDLRLDLYESGEHLGRLQGAAAGRMAAMFVDAFKERVEPKRDGWSGASAGTSPRSVGSSF